MVLESILTSVSSVILGIQGKKQSWKLVSSVNLQSKKVLIVDQML